MKRIIRFARPPQTMRKEAMQRVDIVEGEEDTRTQAGPRGVGRRLGTGAKYHRDEGQAGANGPADSGYCREVSGSRSCGPAPA